MGQIRKHIRFFPDWVDANTEREHLVVDSTGKTYQIRWRPQYSQFELVERIDGDNIEDKPNESKRLQRVRKRAKSKDRRNRGSVSNPDQ